MANSLPVAVYTPESELRHPGRLMRAMATDLVASRELAWRLFVRNISAQYRQSILGYAWAFAAPAVTILPFIFLTSQGILNLGETDVPYPVYVVIGTLLWQGFLDAVTSPLRLVISARAMLTKTNFPREAVVLAGIGEIAFNFVIRLLLLIPVLVWFRTPLAATAALAPFAILMLVILGFMIGMLLVPLGILYNDVERGIGMVMTLWFYATPVVYPPPTAGSAALLNHLNPVSPVLITIRELLTRGHVSRFDDFLLVAGGAMVLLLLSWVMYRVAMPHLIERMSA